MNVYMSLFYRFFGRLFKIHADCSVQSDFNIISSTNYKYYVIGIYVNCVRQKITLTIFGWNLTSFVSKVKT